MGVVGGFAELSVRSEHFTACFRVNLLFVLGMDFPFSRSL